MKDSLLKTVFVLCIILLSISCEKKADNNCDFVKAQIVRIDCDRIVLQLLTDKAIGDAEWRDVINSKTYNNVVYYSNVCALQQWNKQLNDILYIKIDKTQPDNNIPCAQCMAISIQPPLTGINITNISNEPCNTSGR
jgi:hypothetical protein